AQPDFAALPLRDRALVRALVATVLRRLGTLRHLLSQWVKLPARAPRLETALLVGAAQMLWLDVADHAAVDLAGRLVQADRRPPCGQSCTPQNRHCPAMSRATGGRRTPPPRFPQSSWETYPAFLSPTYALHRAERPPSSPPQSPTSSPLTTRRKGLSDSAAT